MRVKATALGYYDNKRRRAGEVFTLKPVEVKNEDGKIVTISADKFFSKKWMEKLDSSRPAPEKKGRQKEEGLGVARAAHEPAEESDDVI